MNLLFVCFVLVGYLVIASNAQACISPRGFNPNICEFTASDSFVNDIILPAPQKCVTANSNPFAMYPPMNNAPQNQAACNTAIQGDGSSCVNAYAKYQCASKCAICGKKPCLSLCTALPATCPSAAALNCFQLTSCALGETNCVNYDIDSSEIPSFSTTKATTKATTSTSTTTKASTNTGTTTSGASTGTSTTSGVGVIQINYLMMVALCFITLSYSFIF